MRSNNQLEVDVSIPDLFVPHPHLADEVNDNICQSEIDGGVFVDHLPIGAKIEVRTQNRSYFLENQGDAEVMIQGHPEFCPKPVLVTVHGSTWGGSMIKVHFIGRGMHLEFGHPEFHAITTSRIQDIREIRS